MPPSLRRLLYRITLFSSIIFASAAAVGATPPAITLPGTPAPVTTTTKVTFPNLCSIPSAHPDCQIASPAGSTAAPAKSAPSPDPANSVIASPPSTTSETAQSPAPKYLWDRIRAGFSMPKLDDPLVAQHQAWYLNHPQTLQLILDRSRRYLYYIAQEIEERQLPMELALLPAVESSFNPMALSRARALGIWQFIPSTGKLYQLKKNAWLDERRDIVASTEAALEYLQNAYETFGDWFLALAAYNWGEINVSRAMRKNAAKELPADYLDLKMPRETRNYVPRLLALRNIIQDASLLGVELPPLADEPYFNRVPITTDIDISTAAKLANISVAEFVALNPAYHRPMIQGQAHQETTLNLPTENVDIFLDNLQRQMDDDQPLSKWEMTTLQKGQTLQGIATARGLPIDYLRRINGLKAKSTIHTGMAILVPRKGVTIHHDVLASLPMDTDLIKTARISRKKHGKRRTTKKSAVAARSTDKKAVAGKRPSGKAALQQPQRWQQQNALSHKNLPSS